MDDQQLRMGTLIVQFQKCRVGKPDLRQGGRNHAHPEPGCDQPDDAGRIIDPQIQPGREAGSYA